MDNCDIRISSFCHHAMRFDIFPRVSRSGDLLRSYRLKYKKHNTKPVWYFKTFVSIVSTKSPQNISHAYYMYILAGGVQCWTCHVPSLCVTIQGLPWHSSNTLVSMNLLPDSLKLWPHPGRRYKTEVNNNAFIASQWRQNTSPSTCVFVLWIFNKNTDFD